MNEQIICFCEIIKSVIHPHSECRIKDEVDWNCLIQMAKEQNVLPIFIEGAIKFPSYTDRIEYDREMKAALTIVGMQVRHTSTFLTLYNAFVEAEVYPIVMKGLICRNLYGRFSDHRPSGDEDILIPITDYWKAKNVLVANGYMPERDIEEETQLEWLQEVSFIHPNEKLHIELHLNPMGRETDVHAQMSDYFENVFSNYREIQIKDVRVRTMNHQEHLLYLILHAFKHFTGGGFGIRQMLDILLYQDRYGAEIDLKQLNDRLHRIRADVFWSDMIYIGNTYFGFELPTLQKANCPQELLEDMFICGVFGNKTKAEKIAARSTMLATGNYLKNRGGNFLIMILKSIFPSKDYLMYHSPYLEKKPWLLPIAWIKRWGRFIKKNRNNETNLATESLKISRRRMRLLKKYDLV